MDTEHCEQNEQVPSSEAEVVGVTGTIEKLDIQSVETTQDTQEADTVGKLDAQDIEVTQENLTNHQVNGCIEDGTLDENTRPDVSDSESVPEVSEASENLEDRSEMADEQSEHLDEECTDAVVDELSNDHTEANNDRQEIGENPEAPELCKDETVVESKVEDVKEKESTVEIKVEQYEDMVDEQNDSNEDITNEHCDSQNEPVEEKLEKCEQETKETEEIISEQCEGLVEDKVEEYEEMLENNTEHELEPTVDSCPQNEGIVEDKIEQYEDKIEANADVDIDESNIQNGIDEHRQQDQQEISETHKSDQSSEKQNGFHTEPEQIQASSKSEEAGEQNGVSVDQVDRAALEEPLDPMAELQACEGQTRHIDMFEKIVKGEANADGSPSAHQVPSSEQSAKKAASLRAKFEKWEAEEERRNEQNKDAPAEDDEVRPSLDTARNLKAMFEEKAQEAAKPMVRERAKVNRFV